MPDKTQSLCDDASAGHCPRHGVPVKTGTPRCAQSPQRPLSVCTAVSSWALGNGHQDAVCTPKDIQDSSMC
jgi:hypothetical protein